MNFLVFLLATNSFVLAEQEVVPPTRISIQKTHTQLPVQDPIIKGSGRIETFVSAQDYYAGFQKRKEPLFFEVSSSNPDKSFHLKLDYKDGRAVREFDVNPYVKGLAEKIKAAGNQCKFVEQGVSPSDPVILNEQRCEAEFKVLEDLNKRGETNTQKWRDTVQSIKRREWYQKMSPEFQAAVVSLQNPISGKGFKCRSEMVANAPVTITSKSAWEVLGSEKDTLNLRDKQHGRLMKIICPSQNLATTPSDVGRDILLAAQVGSRLESSMIVEAEIIDGPQKNKGRTKGKSPGAASP